MLLGLLAPWIALAAVPTAPAPGAAPAADPEYDQLTDAITESNHEEVFAHMLGWVAAHPKHPNAARGLIWMAQLHRADGQPGLARPLFERTLREYPESTWALNAIQGLAELDQQDHHYDRAIAGFDLLARNPTPLWNYIGRMGGQSAREERVRYDIFLGLLAALAGLSLFRLWRAGGLRVLWPPPAELIYPLPILLLTLAGSTSLEVPEGHTVMTIALGAMVLLWLNGASLRARPPKGAGRWVEAALGVLQAGALLYCAVITNGLWGKLVDTIAMGAE